MYLINRSLLVSIIAVTFAFGTVPPALNKAIPEHLRNSIKRIQSEYDQGYWADKFRVKLQNRASGSYIINGVAAVDTVNVPIVFGRYSNSAEKITTATFQQLLFDGPNPTGTMTQFYMENSYNQLYMTGKCLGWFSAPRSFDYYVHDGGGNNAGLEYGGRDFTIDVFIEADKTIDFSKFVKYVDGEGAHVPQLGIVHTGGDAASGADNIWSHRWEIRSRLNERKVAAGETIVNAANVTAAGRYITNDLYHGLPVIFDGDYAIQPELTGNSNTGTSPKKIGVFTHEFGHIFGLPDLYDTDGTSEGLGGWCLMAAGSYGGDQRHEDVPAHMSAWCKEQLGWVTPTLVTSYLPNQKIRHGEKYPEIFRINVRGLAGGQYFLIENRQQIGFDKYLTNSGLLIFHVDPSRTSNRNENRYQVDLEQADGFRSLNLNQNRGDTGDPFPGTSDNRNFDGFTNPNSNDYSLLASYVGVRNISASDTNMFADIDVGTRPYLQLHGASFAEGISGNANGRIDAGESGSIRLKVENIYPVNAVNAELRISTTANDVSIDTSATMFSMNGLKIVDSVFNINVTASPSAISRIIPLTVKVKTAEAVFQKSFEVMLGYPGIVLVDLDSVASTENVGGVYRSLLEKIGKHFELISSKTNSLSLMNLPARTKTMIVSGRKKSNIISDSLAQQLMTFMNTGGKVFLSGQNIAEDMKQRSSTYAGELLHSTWTKNLIVGKVPIGIAGDVLGSSIPKLSLAGGDAMPNQNSPDEINIDGSGAHPFFRWNTTSGTNYGGLWWQHPTNGSKLIFLSFGLEGANDSAVGVTSKSAALTTFLNWFDGITSSPEIGVTIPRSVVLNDNYPNPFNPATTITFSLPSEQHVSLKVYDILGKEVQTLVNEKRSAGIYSLPFNASSLSSGIYFYTLRSGNFIQTKKMTVLK